MIRLFALVVEVVAVRFPAVQLSGGIHQINRENIAVPAVRVIYAFQLDLYRDLHIVRRVVKNLEHRFDSVAFVYLFG